MKIVKQTATMLTIKANPKTGRLALGVLMLVVGLLVVSLVRVRTLGEQELIFPRIAERLEAGAEDPALAVPSSSEISLRLAYRLSKLSTDGARPFVALAILGIIVGSAIVMGPNRSQILIFDKSKQQLTIKYPRWFLRAHVQTHQLSEISDIRVERDHSPKAQGDYGVSLVLSHSEGVPLNRNYIHYKKVFPLSEAYNYKQQSAQTIVERLTDFLNET